MNEVRAEGLKFEYHPHPDIVAKLLAKESFDETFPQYAIDEMRTEYAAALTDQSRILSDGTYIELGGKSLARLPNLISIVICGGDGSIPPLRIAPLERLPPASACWVRRLFKHPIARTLKRPVTYNGRSKESHSFVSIFLRLSTVAQAPISELVSVTNIRRLACETLTRIASHTRTGVG